MEKKYLYMIIGAVACVAVASLVVISNLSSKNEENDSTSKDKSSSKEKTEVKKTGLYLLDYDYASLKEGGDGSEINLYYNVIVESCKLDEMPDCYFRENKITEEEIASQTFEESNSRYSKPFVSSTDDYILFNIDGKSTVKEAYDKGWYAIFDLDATNYSADYKHTDPYESFEAIVKGLGKPYCVIRSQEKTPDDYTNNNVFIIYKLDNAYYLLNYYDNYNYNSEKENMDLLDSFWIASEDMLKAYIKDNMGSNSVDNYTQSYLFQNGKNLID